METPMIIVGCEQMNRLIITNLNLMGTRVMAHQYV